jgi:hypothetical protein
VRTSNSDFLDGPFLERSRELSGHLASLLGNLFEISVPRCETEHCIEKKPQGSCPLWTCLVQAAITFALDLSIKLQQRSFKTCLRWPVRGQVFDETTMMNESGKVVGRNPVVCWTFMPVVIDLEDHSRPNAIDSGVWYRARVLIEEGAK